MARPDDYQRGREDERREHKIYERGQLAEKSRRDLVKLLDTLDKDPMFDGSRLGDKIRNTLSDHLDAIGGDSKGIRKVEDPLIKKFGMPLIEKAENQTVRLHAKSCHYPAVVPCTCGVNNP